ncbi:hypothetical protein N9955_00785 [bacterium]|nr:hypothetical protein [bacterium]
MDDPTDPKKYEEEIRRHEKESPSKVLDISTLEEFEITDGKDRTKEDIEKIKELEDLLGIRDANSYGTNNREVFDEKLADMTVTDMQNLAMRIGIPPTRDRVALRNNLRNSFDGYLKKHSVGAVGDVRPIFDENTDAYKKMKKLMEE